MKTSTEKASDIFALIDELDVSGKARLMDVIAQKMVLDFNLKDVRADHIRQKSAAANTRLLKDMVKIFTYSTTD